MFPTTLEPCSTQQKIITCHCKIYQHFTTGMNLCAHWGTVGVKINDDLHFLTSITVTVHGEGVVNCQVLHFQEQKKKDNKKLHNSGLCVYKLGLKLFFIWIMCTTGGLGQYICQQSTIYL